MTIHRLQIKNFRNIPSAEIHPVEGINLFVGENGSGKTSLLEAIHLLSLVRSFRSKKLKSLIHHEAERFTVFAQIRMLDFSLASLGVQRGTQDDETEILFRGVRPSGVAELTSELPVQLINPDAFRLLEGSPRERRQFVDWGVFHVEHEFIYCWQRFQRALKQRNSLLRHGRIDTLQLQLWEKEIALNGEQITAYRQSYLDHLKPLFEVLLQRFLEGQLLKLVFQRGWDKNISLAESLETSRSRDIEQGFTQSGPQRADIRISVDGRPAMDVLSRGQQKLVVSALKLAQGELLAVAGKKQCVYLIDDLPAELDKHHRSIFCQVLEEQAGQVFITSVDEEALAYGWQQPEKNAWFHVEHGQISPKALS
ncbi:MAG: DNA replication/repair protein RecF [Marinospirillum sp.]|uniref:DNA replication/repair protein RecF n=1 Tax=Marinospirillum sp. TaxID=2183934 RepID=UPI0019E00F29|nr:DNA replication/repair protein RecF [Marinospirillum sp.]MBE0505138.1 DNA replication/repair protein RecF [Marinospirillum sp.]